MTISSNRMSSFSHVPAGTDSGRPKGDENMKKDMWSSMLDGVASGKRLPEKNLLVLGVSEQSTLKAEITDLIQEEALIRRKTS